MERISITLSKYQENGSRDDHEPLLRAPSLKPNVSTTDGVIIIDSVDFIISYHSNLHFYQQKELHFRNCTFTNDGTEKPFGINSQYHGIVKLETCQFQNISLTQLTQVVILNSQFDSLKLNGCEQASLDGLKLDVLSIINCPHVESLTLFQIRGALLNISDSNFFGNLDIRDTSFKNYKIDRIGFKKGSFIFSRNQIASELCLTEMTGILKCSIQDNHGRPLVLKSVKSETLRIYRNKCDITLEDGSFIDGKINRNRGNEIKVKNIDISDLLIVEKNIDQELVFDQQDVSKIQFTDNHGNLTLSNIHGTDSPSFVDNEFERISIANAKSGGTQWDLKVGNCKDLAFKSSELHSLEISGDEIQTIALQDCSCKLDLNIKKVNTLRIDKILSNQESILKIDSAETIEIASSEFSKVELVANNIQSLTISDSSLQLNLTAKELSNLSFDNLKQGQGSVLKIDSAETIEILTSEFSQLTLSATESELIELFEIDTKTLEIQNSDTKKIILRDIKTSNLNITDVKAEELNLITSEAERNKTIHRCEFSKSELETCTIENHEFKQFYLEEFTSEKFNVLNTSYEDLSIKTCSSNWIGIGDDSKNKSYDSGWFLEHQPTGKTEILDSSLIENFVFDSSASPQNDPDFGQPITMTFRETNFGSVSISHCYLKLISSEYCKFENFTIEQIHSGKSITEIALHQCDVNTLNIDHVVGKLAIDSNVIGTIEVNNSPLQILSLIECQTSNKGFSIQSLTLENSDVKDVLLTDSDIKNISISNVHPQSLKIKNIKVNDLYFYDFAKANNSSGKYELRSINKTPDIEANTFSIVESDFTGLSFNSCYFSTFKQLSVKESKLDEIKCTATTWPALVTSPKDESQHFEIREACRQLKLAMANHHDKVSELQFHALEMNAYKSIVYSRWKDWRHWNDVLSLFAGSTNKFGLNWFRPIWLVFFTISLFYGGIVWSHYGIIPFTEGYLSCWNPSDYFQLYNPTHRLSQLNLKGDISGLTATIDFFSKIASAFFIYQVVAAFRKFRRS